MFFIAVFLIECTHWQFGTPAPLCPNPTHQSNLQRVYLWRVHPFRLVSSVSLDKGHVLGTAQSTQTKANCQYLSPVQKRTKKSCSAFSALHKPKSTHPFLLLPARRLKWRLSTTSKCILTKNCCSMPRSFLCASSSSSSSSYYFSYNF